MNEKEVLLDVTGMSCPSCIRQVNAALGELEGVSQVDVRLRDSKVFVQYDPQVVNENDLIDALREAGYQATRESHESGRGHPGHHAV